MFYLYASRFCPFVLYCIVRSFSTNDLSFFPPMKRAVIVAVNEFKLLREMFAYLTWLPWLRHWNLFVYLFIKCSTWLFDFGRVPWFSALRDGRENQRTVCNFNIWTVVIQESRAVAEKPHDAVVKFDTYRNLQRHRAFLPAIARHLVYRI